MVDVERRHEPTITGHKKLLAEGLFQLIGGRIVEGELAPGMRIRDADLAAELAVSRTPVREALQRLERIGLVTMYPSRYTEVSTVTPESIQVAREFAGLQAGIIVRLSCPRLAEDELATATALIADVADSVDDPFACSHARRQLMGFLSSRTGNPLQQSLIEEVSLALARSLRDFVIAPEHRRRMVEGCAQMIDALHRRDADAAEQACRRLYAV
ncbi:GntR family transcriptional regulator [Microbacterium esteraromaticum]|uniref:GntR family transcriptional regulator n=1 Tax=Microbacterium esteraromaticum TaxID=57043 RepID=UPI001CD7A315|nr:GntR family transcriptional regulator [Microbacterium esteraromaticum]MCA1307950.1 GntR family transcriptional regulator [Microbacterium esteraromaticum]WDH78369.1 GntR family transcriptional regulator [Microbacterium esteraromaticum]